MVMTDIGSFTENERGQKVTFDYGLDILYGMYGSEWGRVSQLEEAVLSISC